MPTGYTSDLYDGKDVTFSEFALRCARNFGALLPMRDEALDAAIPDEFQVGDYYIRRLTEDTAERQRIMSLTKEEAAAEANAAADDVDLENERCRQEAAERKSRYLAMLEQVNAWTPPTEDHVCLKEFMKQQLTESIKYDCSIYDCPGPPRDGEVWREGVIAELDRSIARNAEEHASEVKRTAERNAWLRALRQSLSV